ncbi:MAG: phosphatase PAP2 family protein [Rhodospirillales bacterium]|nr:phosphatase PAP2 family protein [Rhodospirillales bacterium]MCB9996277.1 phosphatase PAP2 family protein [Rhodospirillales bacterium]
MTEPKSPIQSDPQNNAAASASRHGNPRMFFIIGGAFICFAVVAVILSQIAGTSFTAPTERISQAIGISYAIPFLVGITGYFLIQLIAHLKAPGVLPLRERMKNILFDCYFLLLFVGVVYLHFQIKAWMPLINPVMHDDFYMMIDRKMDWFIGAMRWVRGLVAGSTSRVDFLYQIGFLAMFATSLWAHSMGHRRWHYHNMVAILIMQMIGALTYLIAPAVGPFMFEQGPNAAATEAQQGMLAAFQMVQEQGAAWLQVHGGDYFTGPPAAMPSLHIAGALIMSWYIVRAKSVLAPFMVMMTCWIFIESVVSRWHYLIDLPPGLVLGLICILITDRICRVPE